jgi:uncharacterized membrane protein
MKALLGHLKSRPRMVIATVVGIAVALLLPDVDRAVTRALLGWNAAVWLYLVLLWWTMWRDDHERMRRVAVANAENASMVLMVIGSAAIASIVAIVLELANAKGTGAHHAVPAIGLALVTVMASWVLLPTLFALNYASLYYGDGSEQGSGLIFPDKNPEFRPDYSDFIYFSVTIAVASQTADVAISGRKLRRLVLVHSALSFLFNTSILALMVNIAAGLF